MLDIRELENFENYLRSGQLEESFRYASEEKRYQILELLEKIMDVAELADEAASRIIYRGMGNASPVSHNPDISINK